MSDFTKFIFASDFHGEENDKEVVKELFKFTKDFKPDINIFGGDLFDFKALRRGASEEDKSHSMVQDVNEGISFLKKWNPQVFLSGNHDFPRLELLAQSRDAVKADLAIRLIGDIKRECNLIKCVTYPYDKKLGIYKLGQLKMLHGYAHGIGATRKHGLVYGSCLHGHTHHIECVYIERHEKTVARSVGALCQTSMPYNAAQIGTLRQQNGWAYGWVHKRSGNFYVAQSEKIDGKWILPTI